MGKMYEVFLQKYILEDYSWGGTNNKTYDDGFSLHLSKNDLDDYTKERWESQSLVRSGNLSYASGEAKKVTVNEATYLKLKNNSNEKGLYINDSYKDIIIIVME